MKIPYRSKNIQYESSREKVTSFSGLKLLFDLANKLGILSGLAELTVKKRKRGIPIEDFVLSLVSNFIVGGDSLSDLELLRHEGSTRGHLYDLEVPAATTAGEYLRKFHIGNIKQLEAVNTAAMLQAGELLGGSAQGITLDLDSSIFETYGYQKEGARYGYTRQRGFHPLLCFWSERRLLTGFRLRAGNRNTHLGAESFLRENLARLPKDMPIYLRADSGFYSHEIEKVCVEHGVEFSLSARMTSKLRGEILNIPGEKWHSYSWQENAEWAEMRYKPKNFSKPYRLLVKRTPSYENNQLTFEKYFYVAALTNRRGGGAALLKKHFARGGAENYIEEFKNGIGARITPSQKFHANWAWLAIAQLAYNLVQWFKLLALKKNQLAWQMKKLRLYWFCVPARIVKSARKTIAYLARPPDIAEGFLRAQNAIHSL